MMVALTLWAARANSQTNVRAWNADGQVFVVWELDTQDVLTYNVFTSPEEVSSTSDATRRGLLFEPEWKGLRLKLANPAATWRIPDGNGGKYQLTPNEGLFVFTPHSENILSPNYFYVTKNTDTLLTSANSTPEPLQITYNPVADPVRCHLQLAGTTNQGFPYAVFAMWVDGRNNPNDARPDFPVMANTAKNGAPHVFAVFLPQGGAPPGPYPAVVCLHGGGPQGSYWSYAPNSIQYKNTGNVPVDGITIAFDDRLYLSTNGMLNNDRPSNWFGWHTQLNPLNAFNAPPNAIVVPYTLRRLMWTLDWLVDFPAYDINPDRMAVMGNSMGGTGTLLLSRWKPERFSAATAFVPPHYTPETGGRLFGTSATNLLTTETGPDGTPLRVNDFFDPATRISPLSRDFCLTRIYRGRCDDAAEWGNQHLQLYNELNDSGLGAHLYWDNRDHTASDWTTDNPANNCPDIGQWVSPVMTERCSAAYQSRFSSNQSYPGFFNDDQQPSLPGRQPELGNGDAADGDAWGTWGGYYDWDVNSIVDSTHKWECTIFLAGQSAASVDNYPGDSASCDVTIRKPGLFLPEPGTELYWQLLSLPGNQVLQSGATQPDPSGVVSVNGLTLFKDPARTRLVIGTQPFTAVDDPGTMGKTLSIFPNPAAGRVFIGGRVEGELDYRVISPLGQVAASGRTSGQSFSVSQLAPGLYTVLLYGQDGGRHALELLISR